MFDAMEMTKKQKSVKARRDAASAAYSNKGDQAVSAIVTAVANKFSVSEVTIYADLKTLGLTGKNQ